MKVTLAQIAPRLGRLADNINRHRELIGAGWADGTDLLLFPELSLTGYLLRDYTAQVALTTAELTKAFAAVPAGERDLDVVLGFVELSAGGHCYNAAAWLHLSPARPPALVHVHRKVHLPTYGMFDEGRYFSPGRRCAAFDGPGLGRAGLLLCEDAWHPSSVFLLAVDGPEYEGVTSLITLANSPARGVQDTERETVANLEVWRRLNALWAELYGLTVFHVQRVGVEDQYVFTGGSEILAPGGEPLVQAPLFDEALLSVELDPAALSRRQRSVLPREPAGDVELVRRELARIAREVYR